MKQLTVRMPDELHKQLKLYSVEVGKEMGHIVNKLVEKFLASKKRQRR